MNYNGIYTALLTPFDSNNKINEKALEQLVKHNVKLGVTGFYVGGSTAEAFLMSKDERKQIMEDNADAFVIVPGGIGTFEEFFEILTLKQLCRHNKPIVLYNVNGFWDNIVSVIGTDLIKGFISPEVANAFSICETPASVFHAIEAPGREDDEDGLQ